MTKSTDRRSVEEKMRDRMTSTRLESTSIFDDELKARASPDEAGARALAPVDQSGRGQSKSGARESFMGASLIRDHMRHAIDPDPLGRMLWERKMVVREVTRKLDPKGRETRAERIKRTERETLSKSPWLATSTKKLVHLAHQISGKTLEEARTQMKFSKKKFAREVLYELDFARDKAVVERGMGLGKANGEFKAGETETKTVKDFRHGKWVEVDDPTRMYVSEAWVNRGPWRGKKPNFRARGRVDLIQMPQASKSDISCPDGFVITWCHSYRPFGCFPVIANHDIALQALPSALRRRRRGYASTRRRRPRNTGKDLGFTYLAGLSQLSVPFTLGNGAETERRKRG